MNTDLIDSSLIIYLGIEALITMHSNYMPPNFYQIRNNRGENLAQDTSYY